jgi:hypothetical protein
MFLPKFMRGVVFCGFISAVACASACSSDKTANESSSLGSDVVRDGTTTTAALNEFLGTEADDWPWAGGQFVTPMDQAVVPADPVEVFTWNADSTDPPDPSDTLDPAKQQGQTFLLVFSVPSNPKLLRVFTNLTTYTPSADAWQKLVSAGEPLTLSITSATFENDKLTGDGGPHSGQTLTFTIQ